MRDYGNKKALGEAAKTVMVSSIKGNTGHLLGAAGGIEAIASIKSQYKMVLFLQQ